MKQRTRSREWESGREREREREEKERERERRKNVSERQKLVSNQRTCAYKTGWEEKELSRDEKTKGALR